MRVVKKGWEQLKGYKTYIVALVAIVYGLVYKDSNAVILGLMGLGLRHGLATTLSLLLKQLTRRKK